MLIRKIYRFYLEGFKSMTIGKTLWFIIIVKLFIMFIILKLFFFPSFLRDKTDEEKVKYVSSELLERSQK